MEALKTSHRRDLNEGAGGGCCRLLHTPQRVQLQVIEEQEESGEPLALRVAACLGGLKRTTLKTYSTH